MYSVQVMLPVLGRLLAEYRSAFSVKPRFPSTDWKRRRVIGRSVSQGHLPVLHSPVTFYCASHRLLSQRMYVQEFGAVSWLGYVAILRWLCWIMIY